MGQPGELESNKGLLRFFGAVAPFGRTGKALGFRWIMPFGTIPLPFHPWLALLLPFLIPAFILYRIAATAAGEGGGATWLWLLILAGVLAVPMVIPIVSWLALAFRVPLLQGLLIAGAMVLIVTDVAAGVASPWLVVIPAVWTALYAVQRIGGPIYLRRLQAANAAFAPIGLGERTILVERDRVASNYADWLMRHHDLPRVACDPDPGGRTSLSAKTYLRLTPADHGAMAERVKRLKPKDWQVGDSWVAVPGLRDLGPQPLRLRSGPHRAPLWLVAGHRTKLEIADGNTVHRLVGGEAAIVGAVPLFTCFYWLSIFGGRSQWVAGFARDKAVHLGTSRVYDMFAAAFAPLGEAPIATVDATALIAELDAMDDEQRAAATAVLDQLLDPAADPLEHPAPLWQRPDVAFGRGEVLCARLAQARDGNDQQTVELLATLIAALPDTEYRALGETLLGLLNSKRLAFRLIGGIDPSVLDLPESERDKHVIGGFSLVRNVPRLYERLSELGEPARALIMSMGELGRWPPALINARDRLDGKPVKDYVRAPGKTVVIRRNKKK